MGLGRGRGLRGWGGLGGFERWGESWGGGFGWEAD